MEGEDNAMQKEEVKPETKPLSMIESAKAQADRLKEENERFERNLARLEELKAFDTLGGKTDAGEQPEQPKEESPSDYVKRIQSEVKSRKL